MHTVLPPEQVIPPHFTDPAWIRADFSGVTIPGAYTPVETGSIIAAGGVTMTSGRWTGLVIPFVIGANTTPPTMLDTTMLLSYPRTVQDVFLTEHAERGYDDVVVAPEGWNLAPHTPDAMLAWCRYVKSWGFRVVLWRGSASLGIDAMLHTLLDAGVVSFYCHGKEVDAQMTSQAYEASLQQIDAYVKGAIPIGVHFSADDMPPNGRGMGYPLGFPRDTFMPDWSLYDGRVHLCSQQNVNASAGLQGAAIYYARLHVNCGIGDAARGPGAPHSRVINWESKATAKLYNACTEGGGCLQAFENLCGTRDDPRALPVSGSADGLRYPDGTAV